MSFSLVGENCLLRIAGEEPNGELLLVEGLRNSGWKVRSEEVDVTNAADHGWRRLLSGAGLRSLAVSFSGLYLGSAGELRLRDLAFTGQSFQAEVTLEKGKVLRGMFMASQLELDSTVNEEATYSAVLHSAGPISIS